MRTTIFNNNFSSGNMANFAPQVKDKYTCYVYQGDTSDTQPMNSAAYAAGEILPTGSICYLDDNGLAKAGLKASTTTMSYVPYIVKVGTDKKTAASEKGNAAGGIVTLLPLNADFRLVTSVFDEANAANFKAGTKLTAKSVTFNGQTVYAVSPAGSGDTVIGICDAPVSIDIKGNKAVKFTAAF